MPQQSDTCVREEEVTEKKAQVAPSLVKHACHQVLRQKLVSKACVKSSAGCRPWQRLHQTNDGAA